MASTKIQNLPLKAPIGAMKIPTGGFGDYSITVSSIGDFIIDAFNLATKDYVDNLLVEKEDRIDLTDGYLTPTSQNANVPNTTNDVIDEVAQALLDRIEYVKDIFGNRPLHNELNGRSEINAHPSTSISHGSGTVSSKFSSLDSNLNNINNNLIPNINNNILLKQDKIVNDSNFSEESSFAPVPSTNSSFLNTSLQALVNRDDFLNVQFKKGITPAFDQAFADKIGGYSIGAELVLSDGITKVFNTVANNTVNPNSDLTGWVKPNEASYILDESGSTQQDVNNLTVHLDTYLKKMNTPPTDDISTVLNQIKADGVKRLYVKSREYIVNSLIEFTSDFEFVNEVGTVFNFGNTGGFYAHGTHTDIGSLTSDITENISNSFTMSDTSQVKQGDWLVLYCTEDYSFSPYRQYYRKGEFIEVAGVSGNTVTFYGRAYDSYLSTESVRVLKVNPINFKWNFIETKSTEANENVPIVIDYARNIKALNFKNTGGKYAGIRFRRCFGLDIGINSAKNTAPANTLNYAIQISNCQDFNYSGGRNNSTRHAVALGGDGEVGCVPCRKGHIYGATLFAELSTSGADMHGNVANVTYDHCTTTYATMGGSDNTYQFCDIYERTDAQGCVISSEPRGGTLRLIKNNYYTWSPLSTYAVIHCIIEKQLKSDLTIIVDGGQVFGTGSASAQFLTVRQSNNLNEQLLNKVNLVITGNVVSNLDQHQRWAWVEDGTIGRYTVPIGYIIVDAVINTKDTAQPYLVYPSQSTTAVGVKTRQMRQAGNVNVTSAVNNTATRSEVINLRYKYSKQPNYNVSIGNILGQAAWDATYFNEDISTDPLRTPVACNSYITATSVRPAVLWNKKVVTAKTFNLSWVTSIDEI